MKNIKTSAFGIVSLLFVALKVWHGETLTDSDYAALTTAIGLLLAKDFDSSHTKP